VFLDSDCSVADMEQAAARHRPRSFIMKSSQLGQLLLCFIQIVTEKKDLVPSPPGSVEVGAERRFGGGGPNPCND
jgi:hypothetical protein